MARKLNKAVEPEIDAIEPHEEDSDHDDAESLSSDVFHKTMSKAGAAREALRNGILVPKQASVYIKQKYGIDISPQQFSAEKSRTKLRAGGLIPSSHHDASTDPFDPSAKNLSMPGQTDLLQALEIMKPLIDQLGVEKIKRMVDLLG